MDEQTHYPTSRYRISPFAQRQLMIRNQVSLITSLDQFDDYPAPFSQLNALVTGRLVNNALPEHAEQRLLNLRTAVAFITSSPQGFDLLTFGHINDLVTEGIGLNGGELRQTSLVRLTNTEVQLPLPEATKVAKDLLDLRLRHTDYTDRALHVLAYILRRQLYTDGNTATAFLVANHLLAKRGAGLLLVQPQDWADFMRVLDSFYHDLSDEPLCQWLYAHALFGPEDLV
ncbi:MAG TPA: Fic family protein [Candidatus Levilactobacillus faecigallinarum]|uniref:Fic family protein n=1 Tax=Candidatus Levilactobacillus faecigallinarum TaxID=2838638 RepID=A0A9D1QR49_9LACO|nr:Fic family protein [Candidatus Levilactobacillus faecigallinarum]